MQQIYHFHLYFLIIQLAGSQNIEIEKRITYTHSKRYKQWIKTWKISEWDTIFTSFPLIYGARLTTFIELSEFQGSKVTGLNRFPPKDGKNDQNYKGGCKIIVFFFYLPHCQTKNFIERWKWNFISLIFGLAKWKVLEGLLDPQLVDPTYSNVGSRTHRVKFCIKCRNFFPLFFKERKYIFLYVNNTS